MDYRMDDLSSERVDFNDISIESLGVHVLFGSVDGESMKEAVTFLLKANILFKDDVTLVINTDGGETAAGFALVDVIEASRLPVRTVGMGNIMSMGILLLCAGTKGKRIMTKNSTIMAHQFAGVSSGKFHELMSTNKSMEYLKEQFMIHFKRHTRMSEKQINDILFSPSDRYLTPAECKKFGIIDHIVDELPELNLDLAPSRTSSVRSKRRARQ